MATEVVTGNNITTTDSNLDVKETTKAINELNINKDDKKQEVSNNNQEQEEEDNENGGTSEIPLESPEYAIKHPLQNRWTLWYDNPGKKTNQQSWGDHLKRVVTFDTVEDFWRIFNNIRPASKLVLGSNYHLFKEHIEPKWEHPDNLKGGKWIATFKGKREVLDKMWLWAVLACIGENFEDENEICGIVVSVRKPGDRLALWTKNVSNELTQKRIGLQLKKILELPDQAAIGYQVHADSIKRGSSYNNKSKYEV